MSDKKMTIGPSAAAWTRGNTVLASSNSSCPRYYLAKKEGLRIDISPLYNAIGELDEHRYVSKLRREQPNIDIDTQVEFRHPLSDYTEIHGKIDIRLTLPTGERRVVEKKSHISKNQRLEIIRKGKVKDSHLCQIVTYMMVLGIKRGLIVCDYYEFDADHTSLTRTEGREFDVRVDFDTREIFVDGEKYPFGVTDLARFYKIIDSAVQKEELPERPVQSYNQRTNPCVYCPLREICNEAEIKSWTKREFLDKVSVEKDRIVSYENQRRRSPEIWAPAKRKKVKE